MKQQTAPSTPAELREDARQWRADAAWFDGTGATGHARACRAQAIACDKQADDAERR